jgi:hypothetical protein
MERAKSASGKKTEPTDTKHRRFPSNKAERKPRAEKLTCRYCGSDDLAPSFVKLSKVFQQTVWVKDEEGVAQSVPFDTSREEAGLETVRPLLVI